MIRASGITLIEILIALSILAILMLNTNLPAFNRSRSKKEVDGVMADIVSSISMARQAAISENRMVTFCRSNDGGHCQGKWGEGSIIFTDGNADRKINGNDRLLFRLDAMKPEGDLSFHSFGNKQYLQMTPRGVTNYQNGNFTFCPLDKDLRMARQVIVSYTGRTRYAKDKDGDGIVENSKGKPLTCD